MTLLVFLSNDTEKKFKNLRELVFIFKRVYVDHTIFAEFFYWSKYLESFN